MFDNLQRLSQRRRLTAVLLMILIVLTIAFIWGNSLQNPLESMERSGTAEKVVRPVLLAIPIDSWHTPGMITFITRKLGHFLEFFILGIELMALKILLRPALKIKFWPLFLLALLIAAADEGIQLTNGRGAMVQDVMLDSLGAITGLSLIRVLDKLRLSAFREATHD